MSTNRFTKEESQNALNTFVFVSGIRFLRIADNVSIANAFLPRERTKQSLLVNLLPFLEGESLLKPVLKHQLSSCSAKEAGYHLFGTL